ncbi:MAG: polysaccharide biosynthesis/export family protein, partial [Bacteroidetes bacterium]|nr:polysaccharide biosynthesis/export family protein [Bacteroidota bacterium]
MKNDRRIPTRFVFLISLLITLVFSSCTPLTKLKFLRDTDVKGKHIAEGTTFQHSLSVYKIQSHDLLNIRVSGLDEESTKPFNLESNLGRTNSSTTTNLISYMVNDSGEIVLPIIGQVVV